jgi:HD-GYP domain-containing protein (c-di-GMP phosphodiesterase class II)
LGSKGEILLREGVRMRDTYIRRMKTLGIPGAYIDDELSADIEVVSALSEELRARAIKSISDCYSKAANSQILSPRDVISLRVTAESIVDEILSRGDVVLNLMDLKVYDSYTFYHCVNVAVLSVVMGLGLSFTRERLVRLAYAGIMHDVGKVFIEHYIVSKPGRLTDKEYEEIKRHPRTGYDYIKRHISGAVPRTVLMGVLDHHERVDGTGYPSAKTGKKITVFGRVIAVADVYDALTSDRPYRKGVFAVEAMEYIVGAANTLFDFDIVNAFTRKVALFPVGTCVMLSNGTVGLVIETLRGSHSGLCCASSRIKAVR